MGCLSPGAENGSESEMFVRVCKEVEKKQVKAGLLLGCWMDGCRRLLNGAGSQPTYHTPQHSSIVTLHSPSRSRCRRHHLHKILHTYLQHAQRTSHYELKHYIISHAFYVFVIVLSTSI